LKPRDFAALIRVPNSALMGVAVLAGAAVAGGFGALAASPAKATLGFATAFLLTAASMVLNDLYDIDIDRVNAPHRPLPSGRVSAREARALFAALSAAGLAASLAISATCFLIALSSWVLSTAYNVRLKRTGLPGNAVVSYNVAVPLPFGAAVAGSLSLKVALFFAMVFLSCIGREVAKGIADVEGDRMAGVRTVAVTMGPRAAAAVSSIAIAAAVALSPLPYALGLAGPAYLALVLTAAAVFAYSVALLLADPSRETALRAKSAMLAAMALGLAAFLTTAA